MIRSEPVLVGPSAFKVIDSVVLPGSRELLDVDWPGVMIALNGEDLNVLFCEGLFPHFGDSCGIKCDLLLCVVPGVMSRVVAHPGHEVCFKSALVLLNEV